MPLRRRSTPPPPLTRTPRRPSASTLSDEQKEVRDWVHGFASNVIRPAAAEWDEREETPWPVIQEAAKIGLYGFEGIAQFFADPTGLDAADRQRGALLGRRRHRHGADGHVARRRRDRGRGGVDCVELLKPRTACDAPHV